MAKHQALWSDIDSVLQVRIFAYDVLRRTFLQEPCKGYLQTMAEPGFIQLFPFLQENQEIYQGIHQVINYLENNNVLDHKVYDQLHWDYTRLFIGPYQLPAPLWESAYLSEERLLFQESTLQVRHTYAKYGFLPHQYQQEADDHLGLELDFMYQLACLAGKKQGSDVEKLREVVQDSQEFLQNHLLNWIPQLTHDIKNSATTGFYQGIAKVLDGYLQLDGAVLQELTHRINNENLEMQEEE